MNGFFRNGAGFVNIHLILGDAQMDLPVFVGKHPIEKMSKEESIKILRIPSLLGRDVINKFRLIFDKEKEELILG